MEEIVQIISTVGFPIAAFLLMFWYVKTESKETREAINNNTLILQQLIDKIDKDK